MDKLEILGIVGSLRKNSYNRFALKAAQELLPPGVVLNLIEINALPVFNQDDELSPPQSVLEFKQEIHAADAILFATPEYNYSVPGGLKNAIDWGSRPYGESIWHGKPTAILGVSAGSLGTVRAQYHLRQILVGLDMPVVNQPEVMISNAVTKFDAEGNLVDQASREFIQKLIISLAKLAKICPANKEAMG